MNPREKIAELLKGNRSLHSYEDTHTTSKVFERLAKDQIILSELPEGRYWPYHETLFTLGMPRDMALVNILYSGARFNERFSKFAFHFSGVVAEDEDPSKGYTGAKFTADHGHFQFTVYVWRIVLLHRDTTARLVLVWNPNRNPTVTLTLYEGRVGWIPTIDGFRLTQMHEIELLKPGICLLESPEKIQAVLDASKRGGARNVKVSNKPKETKKALGEKYIELRDMLTNVKQDAKVVSAIIGNGWRTHILKKYPVLGNHPDLLDKVDPYGVPTNPDASDSMAPGKSLLR